MYASIVYGGVYSGNPAAVILFINFFFTITFLLGCWITSLPPIKLAPQVWTSHPAVHPYMEVPGQETKLVANERKMSLYHRVAHGHSILVHVLCFVMTDYTHHIESSPEIRSPFSSYKRSITRFALVS